MVLSLLNHYSEKWLTKKEMLVKQNKQNLNVLQRINLLLVMSKGESADLLEEYSARHLEKLHNIFIFYFF